MKNVHLSIALISSFIGFSQTEFVNIEARYSSVAGGTEDGGTSMSKIYVFVADKNIILLNLSFENNELHLKKGDTICFVSTNFEPYHAQKIDTNGTNKGQNIVQPKRSEVTIHGNSYYVNFDWNINWEILRTYVYKNHAFVPAIKEEFDKVYKGYAP